MPSQEELNAAFNSAAHIRYPDDCQRIVEVAAGMCLVLSVAQAQVIWEDYSDSMCAGWLILPSDNWEIQSAIERFIYRNRVADNDTTE